MKKIYMSEKTRELASKIKEECMGKEDAFCVSRCPMSTDVKGYVHLIAEGDYEAAIKLIRDKLFLPNTLGHICAHPCEVECRRNREFNKPIAIAALKRFAAEQADDERLWDISTADATGKNVAIIGFGPAGAQAALDLAKSGQKVTVYEKNENSGGMLRYGIPAYRLPKDILDFEYSILDKIGIEVRYNCEVGKDISFEKIKKSYDAVIIAIGAQKGSIIKMNGSDSEDVFSATEFLGHISREGTFEKAGEHIVVIGGGDVAMDCIRSAIRLPQVTEVRQCSLESEEILPASLTEKEEALEEGMLPNFGFGPQEIITENGRVKAVKVKNVVSIFDENHRFAPAYGEEERTLTADTVIMATGQAVADVTNGMLEQKGGGRYVVDADTLQTSDEKIFVAGDAAGGKIVVEAMALGRKAAISVDRFLTGQDLLENRDLKKEWIYDTKLDIPLPAGTEDLPRVQKHLRPINERICDFNESDSGMSEEDALAEAKRCLQCTCKLCFSECVMLDQSDTAPVEVAERIVNDSTVDVNLSYYCNDCDSCKTVCPKELPIKEMFMETRNDIVRASNGTSPLKGHRAVHIQQELGFSELFTTRAKGGIYE